MVSPGQWWCSSRRWRPVQHSQRAYEQWPFGRGGETCKRVLVGTCALGRAKLGAVRTENWEVWPKLEFDIATFLPLIFMSLAMATSQGGPQSHREPEAEQGQCKELSFQLLPQWFPNHYGSVFLSCPVEKRLSFIFFSQTGEETTRQRGHIMKAEGRQVDWKSWGPYFCPLWKTPMSISTGATQSKEFSIMTCNETFFTHGWQYCWLG